MSHFFQIKIFILEKCNIFLHVSYPVFVFFFLVFFAIFFRVFFRSRTGFFPIFFREFSRPGAGKLLGRGSFNSQTAALMEVLMELAKNLKKSKKSH